MKQKKNKWYTVITIYNSQDQVVGMKLIKKPLTEVTNELLGMKCDLTDTIELKEGNDDGMSM